MLKRCYSCTENLFPLTRFQRQAVRDVCWHPYEPTIMSSSVSVYRPIFDDVITLLRKASKEDKKEKERKEVLPHNLSSSGQVGSQVVFFQIIVTG